MTRSRWSVDRERDDSFRGPFAGEAGFDGIALKPSEIDLENARDFPQETVTIDYEGHEYVPDGAVLERLAADREVRVTVPVRADGFDPLGDASTLESLPTDVGVVLVAGNPAYLDERERTRAIAPRLGAAAERIDDPWVGTEGIERLALATGATQFELLSDSTEATVRGLRAAGFTGDVAVYAPTVLIEEDDEILDAVGEYVSRRSSVARELPSDAATDSAATGRARSVLLEAARKYALVGSPGAVGERIESLRAAGVDTVVGYPARGIEAFQG